MDKKRKILTCLKFSDPISLIDLNNLTGIKNVNELSVLLDILAKDKYVDCNENGIFLYSLSALERYDADKKQHYLPFIINIAVSTLTLLVAIATLIATT